MPDNKSTHWWVAIVYDLNEKVESHGFRGDKEDEVYKEAKMWVRSRYKDEKEYSWDLHHVTR